MVDRSELLICFCLCIWHGPNGKLCDGDADGNTFVVWVNVVLFGLLGGVHYLGIDDPFLLVLIICYWTQILPYLYDKEVIRELAIVRWAEEKGNADESNKVFIEQSDAFIQVYVLYWAEYSFSDLA